METASCHAWTASSLLSVTILCWGYQNEGDIRAVVKGYREHGIPLDSVYLDIDYMEHFKDFTINQERFPDFPKFVEEMKKEHIHLVPIIDAGV